MNNTIRLEKQLGGWRHFIGKDESLHCGDIIELYIDGKWIAGRYEAEGLNVHDKEPIAFFYFDETHYIKIRDGITARTPRQ